MKRQFSSLSLLCVCVFFFGGYKTVCQDFSICIQFTAQRKMVTYNFEMTLCIIRIIMKAIFAVMHLNRFLLSEKCVVKALYFVLVRLFYAG